MRQKKSEDLIEKKTVESLIKISNGFLNPTESIEEIFEQKVKPFIETPFLFNSFHWITLLKERRLIYQTNIKKILGYDEDEFTLEKSIQVIHPGYDKFVTRYGLMAYEMLSDRKYHNLSAVAHYCIQYPMLHKDGKYVLVQMDASVVQIDSLGNPLANYNRFELLGDYLNVPIIVRPRVYFRTIIHNHLAELANEAARELSERVKQNLMIEIGFSKRERVILPMSLDMTIEKIALYCELSTNTIKKQNKSILEKARNTFKVNFPDVRAVADYLKKIDII